jgi:hypothetical protein
MAIAANCVNPVPVDCPDFPWKIAVKYPRVYDDQLFYRLLGLCGITDPPLVKIQSLTRLRLQKILIELWIDCSSRSRDKKGGPQVREHQAIFPLSLLSRLNDRLTRAIAGVDDSSLGLAQYQQGCKLLLINQGWLAVGDDF